MKQWNRTLILLNLKTLLMGFLLIISISSYGFSPPSQDFENMNFLQRQVRKHNLLRTNSAKPIKNQIIDLLNMYNILPHITNPVVNFNKTRELINNNYQIELSHPRRLSKSEIDSYVQKSQKENLILLAFNDDFSLSELNLLYSPTTWFVLIKLNPHHKARNSPFPHKNTPSISGLRG